MEIRCYGHIDEHGKIILSDREQFVYLVKKHVNTNIVFKCKIYKSERRSIQQNRYYWGVVIPFFQEQLKDLGHKLEANEVHDYLKIKFNGREIYDIESNETINIPQSTARLNRQEFNEFIDRIDKFSIEYFNSPLPSKDGFNKL